MSDDSVIHDVVNLKLNPKKAYRCTDKNGHLVCRRQRRVAECIVAQVEDEQSVVEDHVAPVEPAVQMQAEDLQQSIVEDQIVPVEDVAQVQAEDAQQSVVEEQIASTKSTITQAEDEQSDMVQMITTKRRLPVKRQSPKRRRMIKGDVKASS